METTQPGATQPAVPDAPPVTLYDLGGDPFDVVCKALAVQGLCCLSHCSKLLWNHAGPFLRLAKQESERVLCKDLGATLEELAGMQTLSPRVLSGSQCRHLIAWLWGYPLASVTYLNLCRNEIGTNGGVAMGEALKVNVTLTKLDLYRNQIGDEGAIAIGEALRVNATLKTLNLDNNYIRDEGGVAIVEALKVNTTLTFLDLQWNHIGNQGGIAIGEALCVHTSLTTLNLWGNKIGAEGGAIPGWSAFSLGEKTQKILKSAAPPMLNLRL